jgi:hypothetical protein
MVATTTKTNARRIAAERLGQVYSTGRGGYAFNEIVPGYPSRQHNCGDYRSAVAFRAQRRQEIIKAIVEGAE